MGEWQLFQRWNGRLLVEFDPNRRQRLVSVNVCLESANYQGLLPRVFPSNPRPKRSRPTCRMFREVPQGCRVSVLTASASPIRQAVGPGHEDGLRRVAVDLLIVDANLQRPDPFRCELL